jgi:hypothetical protein
MACTRNILRIRTSRDTLYPKNLTLNSLTSDGRWVGIVRSRTEATVFLFCNGEYVEE